MKSAFFSSLIPVLLLLLPSCKDKLEVIQTLYNPVYLSYQDLRVPVKTSQPVSLQKPGKIYIKDQLIFINEYMKGIHVIDNSDPSNPVFISFLDIPGNVDMAVNGSVLFADSYIDLVALDISDPANITETGRAEKIFPYIIPPAGNEYEINWEEVDETKGVIIDWKTARVRKESSFNQYPHYPYPVFNDFLYKSGESTGPYTGNSGGSGTGIGGSMARFTIVNNWLYALTSSDLRVIDISTPQDMIKKNEIYPGWNMETIFPYENYLFLGSQSGMSVYDISTPLDPQFVSRYSHMRSCDPVVVQNDVAYMTLRAGNGCGSSVNRMDVIDLTDITSPVLYKTYPMNPTYGLAIHDSLLYVCQGDWGIKVFDASDPLNPVNIKTINDINGWDVIAFNDLLILIGDDGLYQYRIAGIDNIQQISSIPVNITQ